MPPKEAFPVTPSWRFFPAPSNTVTGPLLADQIYPLLMSGFAEPVSAVRKIRGPRSVETVDGRVIDNIDSIIYCTGYDAEAPFIGAEHNPYPIVGEPPRLYRNTFPMHPDAAVRNSLAFLGHAVVPFPGFVMHELNAMCISQVWLGNSPLPSLHKMEGWHRGNIAWRDRLMSRQSVGGTTFYATMLPPEDHIRWLDEVAGTGIFEHFGWFRLQAWALWWYEYELYAKCKYGLFSPAIWRLFSMGKRRVWDKAREQIWKDNELAEQQKMHRNLAARN